MNFATGHRPTTEGVLSMRVAYLECFSGVSGDMFMGALVDAGVSPRLLEEAVAALRIGARLGISRVVRSGISATKVDVWVDGQKDQPREVFWPVSYTHLSTAARNGASLVFEGRLNPVIFLTNCSEAARISSSFTGGSKLKRILIFLHIRMTSSGFRSPLTIILP